MNIEEILNDKFVTEIKEAFISEINELVENDKLGLHKHLKEKAEAFINDKAQMDEVMEYALDAFNDEDDDEDRERFVRMVYVDSWDVLFLDYYSDVLFDCLIKDLGAKYNIDEEGWISEHEEINNKTNYGVIWDNWYSVDTDVRERLSDVLDRKIEEYLAVAK